MFNDRSTVHVSARLKNYGGRGSHFAIAHSAQPIRVRLSYSRSPQCIRISRIAFARPIAYSRIAYRIRAAHNALAYLFARHIAYSQMCEPYVAIIIASYSEQTGCDLVIVEGTLESGNETNTWCTVGPLVPTCTWCPTRQRATTCTASSEREKGSSLID